jgi:hypothetical protein
MEVITMASMKCGRCGRLNENGSHFCVGCGMVLPQAKVRKVKGPPAVLLAFILTLLGLVFVNKYTDFKPLDQLLSMININSAQKVSGLYECHLEAKDLGNGVMRSEQTWGFKFFSDGTYRSTIDGYDQFPGTWSQTGAILKIDVPAIEGISTKYSFTATVGRNGDSFICGGPVYDGLKFIRAGKE